jgi:hypothetical protein
MPSPLGSSWEDAPPETVVGQLLAELPPRTSPRTACGCARLVGWALVVRSSSCALPSSPVCCPHAAAGHPAAPVGEVDRTASPGNALAALVALLDGCSSSAQGGGLLAAAAGPAGCVAPAWPGPAASPGRGPCPVPSSGPGSTLAAGRPESFGRTQPAPPPGRAKIGLSADAAHTSA